MNGQAREKSLKRMAYRRRRRLRLQDVQHREAAWLDGGKLRIPGVHWNVPPHIQAAHDAMQKDLTGWVLGTTDIPGLRHEENDRLMHARGRLSVAKTLLAISLLMDYRTSTIGVPVQCKKTGLWFFMGRSIQFVADVAGISYWACKRAIEKIVTHGGATRKRQSGTDEYGERYGRPSIRRMERDIFVQIGDRTAKAVEAAKAMACRLHKEACEAVRPLIEAGQRMAERAAALMKRAVDKLKDVRTSVTPEIRALLDQFRERNKLPYNKERRHPP